MRATVKPSIDSDECLVVYLDQQTSIQLKPTVFDD